MSSSSRADPGDDARRIAVVLDNLAGAAAPLAWGSALARALERELLAVYVENTSALAAAALPITQALAHGAARWMPYGTGDMARAHRAQVTRLADQLRRTSQQQHIRSSVQVVRDTLQHAAMAIDDRSDLVLVSGRTLSPDFGRPLACRAVLVWAEEGERGQRLQDVAARCAASLGAARRLLRSDADVRAALQAVGDLLVVPRSRASAALLARARTAVLLVGATA